MTETTVKAPGSFCWSEVCTKDTTAAKRFYNGLFGWETQDTPAGEMGIYTMLRSGDSEIGGMYELAEPQKKMGVPPHWLAYVLVENVDETAEKAKSIGGNVVMEPMDVMDQGRMALLQDPSGAVFALWQAKKHVGGSASGPGTPCWWELVSSDRAEAGAFYAALFGWELETWSGEMDYVLFKQGETSVGGAMPSCEVPSHWMTYFAVESCDGAAAKADELGGRVVAPPADIPNVGRSAILADHAGAMFGIIQFGEPAKG